MPNFTYYFFPDVCHNDVPIRFSEHMLSALKLSASGEKVYRGRRNARAVDTLTNLGYLRDVGPLAHEITATGRQAWTKIELTRVTGAAK